MMVMDERLDLGNSKPDSVDDPGPKAEKKPRWGKKVGNGRSEGGIFRERRVVWRPASETTTSIHIEKQGEGLKFRKKTSTLRPSHGGASENSQSSISLRGQVYRALDEKTEAVRYEWKDGARNVYREALREMRGASGLEPRQG